MLNKRKARYDPLLITAVNLMACLIEQAIAKESGATFINVRMGAVQQKFVGEGEKTVSAIFRCAVVTAMCCRCSAAKATYVMRHLRAISPRVCPAALQCFSAFEGKRYLCRCRDSCIVVAGQVRCTCEYTR